MAEKQSKEVAKQEGQLPSLPKKEEMQEIFDANFEGIQPAFEVINVPPGGALQWTIPTLEEDEPSTKKEIIGTILDHYACRAYWPDEYGSGGVPPDCASLDAIMGSKYGKCFDCKYSQWGTGKKDRGQACKKMHRIFILLAGGESIFPYLISLPPTSAEGKYEGSLPTYAVKLTGKLKKIHGVQTKIKLFQDTNKEGIKYSKAQFFYAGDLGEDDKKTAAFLRERLKGAMRQKPFEAGEYAASDESQTGGPEPWDEGPGAAEPDTGGREVPQWDPDIEG